MCESVRPAPFHLLLGVTGSVATIKLPELLRQILLLNSELPHLYNFEVRVVCTERALHFVSPDALPKQVPLYRDADEWSAWSARGDPVLHVELARWAHALLLAPLDANTLAKLTAGICDNLLTCVARAWNSQKPRIYCPAMNTHMWEHPLTAEHRGVMARLGFEEVPVVTKTLVCGDVGAGAMAEVVDIVGRLRDLVANHKLEDGS